MNLIIKYVTLPLPDFHLVGGAAGRGGSGIHAHRVTGWIGKKPDRPRPVGTIEWEAGNNLSSQLLHDLAGFDHVGHLNINDAVKWRD